MNGRVSRRIFALALSVLALCEVAFLLGAFLFPAHFAHDRSGFNLWWAVHFALSWQLLRPGSSTWAFCVAISWIEIPLRTARAAFFLVNPDWSFAPVAWFVQQAATLLLFLLLARHLHGSPAGKELRELR